jgi:hypothetical protein
MKKTLAVSIAVIILGQLSWLAQRSFGLQAEEGPDGGVRYRLVDLGTLGGPKAANPNFDPRTRQSGPAAFHAASLITRFGSQPPRSQHFGTVHYAHDSGSLSGFR